MKIRKRLYLAAVFAIISLISPIIRFFTDSSSHFPIYPQPYLFSASLALSAGGFLLLFSLFSLTSMLGRSRFPLEAAANTLIIVVAVFARVLDFLDVGFQRSTQVRANPSFLQISVFPRGPLFEMAYAEEGSKVLGSTNIEEIIDQFRINPILFPVMLIFILAMVGALVGMLARNFKSVLVSLGFRPTGQQPVKDNGVHTPKWLHILSGVVALAYFTLYLAYLAGGNGRMNGLDLVAPASWVFVRSGMNTDISRPQEKQAVERYRAAIDLPEDRDWLDQRENPVYPLVTASKEIVRAYNPGYTSDAPRQRQKFSGQAPDIFVMLVESFSPSPYYMDSAFITQRERVYSGGMFDQDYLPNLGRVQQSGVAFSGLSSNSLPTFGGWFSFVAGDYQPNYGSSMVLDSYNDLDDLPSSLKQQGYFSQYVSTSPLQFDGKMQYAFRGRKQLRGPDNLGGFPGWFDNIHQYFPTGA